MDETFARLEAEYCPPLDPALLSAILSDFDLNSADSITTARATLDPLKDSALLEEEFGFDASGTGAQYGGLARAARPESCPETSASMSQETDMTSLSNAMSSLDLESRLEHDTTTPGNSDHAEDLESLDEDTKIQLLLDVLQNKVSTYDAQHTLRKCNGRLHAALDELMNHVYFVEVETSDNASRIPAKGIDAFSEDNVIKRGRKGKSKEKSFKLIDERRSSSLPVSLVELGIQPANRWQTSSEDIEFVASRTGISAASVRSIYHNSGKSLSKTIGNILKNSLQQTSPVDAEDPIIAVNAHSLGAEFSTIAREYVVALVCLTHPSTAAAHELAKALTTQPHSPVGGIQIIPNYVRPVVDEADTAWQTATKKSQSLRHVQTTSPVETSDAAQRANAYASARSTALSQAYAAHRKAKSDRLMGGAAAYYGQVGRDLAALSSRASAAAADQLANSQSTPSQLDLHGIDVLNAVRIAQEKVEQWWDGLGESRTNGRVGAQERQAGYNIVVGLGRHSEGGRSKLGPAVSKMLKRDGWKIEADGAVIKVKGRAWT